MPCRSPRHSGARRKPFALLLSIAGSALAHLALVLALAPELTETAMAAPPEPPPYLGPSLFAMRLENPFLHLAPGRPMPALQACFDRETLEELSYRLSEAEEYGYRADQLSSWTEFDSTPRANDLDEEASGALFYSSLVGCLEAARRGTGRVNIRVLRRADGRTRAQAWPLDEKMSDPQLLCCLRESQELLAARVPPGKEAHYEMHLANGRIELSPNPLPRPLERYEVWACGGRACDF